jgi:hypothetical protein
VDIRVAAGHRNADVFFYKKSGYPHPHCGHLLHRGLDKVLRRDFDKVESPGQSPGGVLRRDFVQAFNDVEAVRFDFGPSAKRSGTVRSNTK